MYLPTATARGRGPHSAAQLLPFHPARSLINEKYWDLCRIRAHPTSGRVRVRVRPPPRVRVMVRVRPPPRVRVRPPPGVRVRVRA